MLWEIIKELVLIHFIYVSWLFFVITTVCYFTYRFWKMLLPREENTIFISNAPMIWYIDNENNKE